MVMMIIIFIFIFIFIFIVIVVMTKHTLTKISVPNQTHNPTQSACRRRSLNTEPRSPPNLDQKALLLWPWLGFGTQQNTQKE